MRRLIPIFAVAAFALGVAALPADEHDLAKAIQAANRANADLQIAQAAVEKLAKAQPDPKVIPKPPAHKHGRGHKESKNIKAIHAAAALRHGHRMAKLPKATPPTFDCRAMGWVPPILDQGQCGSCWDFSGSGMCTSAYIKAGYGKNDGSFAFSEQYTLDCGNNGGCDGDDNITVLDWAKTTGLPLASDYGPYTATPGPCKYKPSMTLYKIADWGFCTPAQEYGIASTQDIKNAMVQYGPIGTAVAASSAAWNNPGTSVMNGVDHDIDHDVILVGWDDSKGPKGAWLMRNQWSTSWGDNGYAWIAYGAFDIGTEAVWCTVQTLPPPPPPVPPTPPVPPVPPTPPTPTPAAAAVLKVINPLPAGEYMILTPAQLDALRTSTLTPAQLKAARKAAQDFLDETKGK